MMDDEESQRKRGSKTETSIERSFGTCLVAALHLPKTLDQQELLLTNADLPDHRHCRA